MKQNGNALFLILIAVALFAALSYAVTNSGRGGSGIDKETAEIEAAQIIQEVGRFRNAIMRLEIIDSSYGQVLFNDSATNDSGTCYDGNTSITPCKTIGLFSDEMEQSTPYFSEKFRDPAYTSETSQVWNWFSNQLIVNGVDVGTTASDEFLMLGRLNKEVCEAINKGLEGDSTIGTISNPIGAGNGFTYSSSNKDGTFTGFTQSTSATEITKPCNLEGGKYWAVFVLKEN